MGKKKIMAALLAFCMVATMFTGCEKAASYDDVRKEVEKDLKKELKKELSDEIEEELRDSLTEEIEGQLRDQITEEVSAEYKADFEAQVEEAANGLRDSIEEELRPQIEAEVREELEAEVREEVEAEVREELEAEYQQKLDEAIAELGSGEGAGEGGGSQGPAGEAGYEPVEPDFDVTNFNFDTKHIVVNGMPLSFGTTLCKNIPDEFYGFLREDERGSYYCNNRSVKSMFFAPTNTSGQSNYIDFGTCRIEFCNLNYDGPLLMYECLLYSVSLEAKYLKHHTLESEGITFDIGSGLTNASTYEDFVAVLGEPDFTYDYEMDDGTVKYDYTWGSSMTKGYSIKVGFIDEGVYLLTYTGYIYD